MKNDELDAATVERCAQVAERWLESSWRDEVFAAKSIASAIRSLIAGDVSGSHPRGEAEPVVKQVPSPAETVSNVTANDIADHLFNHAEFTASASWRAGRALFSKFDIRRK